MVLPYSTEYLRKAAAAAYQMADGDLDQAIFFFVDKVGTDHNISHLREYIFNWGVRFDQFGNVANASRDRSSSRKVDSSEALKAAKIFQKGFKSGGRQLPFSSIKDALERSAALKRIQQKCECSPETLYRHMCQADPTGMQSRPVEFRKQLTDEQKMERVKAALWYLQRSDDWFKRVFYTDGAKVVVAPKGYRGTLGGRQVSGGTYVLEDARLKIGKRKTQTIAFYICVNALEGAVAIAIVTGTTGKPLVFMVSAGGFHMQRLEH